MASGMGVFDRWCFSMYWMRSPPSHICMGFPDQQCLLPEVTITHLHEDVALLGIPVVLVRKHLDDERMIKRRMDFADRSHKSDQFSFLGSLNQQKEGTDVSLSEYRRSWGDNFPRLISFMARIWANGRYVRLDSSAGLVETNLAVPATSNLVYIALTTLA
jgi:hypothetical protein